MVLIASDGIIPGAISRRSTSGRKQSTRIGKSRITPVSFLGILVIRAMKREISLKIVPSLIVYLVTLPIFVTLFWPYLWSDPVNHFLESFAYMSKAPWGGEVLVNGERLSALNLPWFYAPLWMLVTIPPYYIVLIISGGVITIMNILRSSYRLWSNEKEMLDSIFLGLSVGPIVIVVLMNSVLFDGWRHLYFVYPPLLLLALPAVDVLGRAVSRVNQRLVWIFFLPLLHPLLWMIQAHPYQNVYFNSFAGKDRFQRWEMDYWGLSNREAIEYILNKDNRDSIKIGALSWTPLQHTLFILKPEDRKRVSITDREPDYWITNFRSVRGNLLEPPPGFQEEYRIVVDREPILLIFKRAL